MTKVTGDANSVTFGFKILFYFEEATLRWTAQDAPALWQTASDSHPAHGVYAAYRHGRIPLLKAS